MSPHLYYICLYILYIIIYVYIIFSYIFIYSFAIYKFFSQAKLHGCHFCQTTKYADSLSSQPFFRTLLLAYFAISSDLYSSFISFLWFLFAQLIYSIDTSKFLSPMKLTDAGHSVNSCNTYCVMFYSSSFLRDPPSSPHINRTWRLVLSFERTVLVWLVS